MRKHMASTCIAIVAMAGQKPYDCGHFENSALEYISFHTFSDSFLMGKVWNQTYCNALFNDSTGN